MSYAYFDASALAKRYVPEAGTPQVNHVFDRLPLAQMIVLNVGAAEVVSLLVRKRNAGRLSVNAFQQAIADFVAEIITPTHPVKLTAELTTIVATFALIDAHSINSTDGIVLQTALALAADCRARGDDIVLISSDQRLLRAATAEGLSTFNPEVQSIADFDALIGP